MFLVTLQSESLTCNMHGCFIERSNGLPGMMSVSNPARIAVLLLLLATSACRTIRVEKPAERYDAPEYHPQYSNINIPLDVNKVQLKKLINKRLSGQQYADTSFGDNDRDNLMMFASRMDSIDAGFENNFLTYRVPLKIYGFFRGLQPSSAADFRRPA